MEKTFSGAARERGADPSEYRRVGEARVVNLLTWIDWIGVEIQ